MRQTAVRPGADRRRAAPDRDQVLSALSRDLGHAGAARVVDIDDGDAILGEDAGEEPGLGVEIRLEIGVIIEMVLRDVGKARRREAHPVKPFLRQTVGGGLHRGVARRPASAQSASSRCRVIGSGVVWVIGSAERALDTGGAEVDRVRPRQSQIWRVKLATDVLPLVPVTATITSGCAPNQSAAAKASVCRGSSRDDEGRIAGGQRFMRDPRALGIGQDRRRALRAGRWR